MLSAGIRHRDSKRAQGLHSSLAPTCNHVLWGLSFSLCDYRFDSRHLGISKLRDHGDHFTLNCCQNSSYISGDNAYKSRFIRSPVTLMIIPDIAFQPCPKTSGVFRSLNTISQALRIVPHIFIMHITTSFSHNSFNVQELK